MSQFLASDIELLIIIMGGREMGENVGGGRCYKSKSYVRNHISNAFSR